MQILWKSPTKGGFPIVRQTSREYAFSSLRYQYRVCFHIFSTLHIFLGTLSQKSPHSPLHLQALHVVFLSSFTPPADAAAGMFGKLLTSSPEITYPPSISRYFFLSTIQLADCESKTRIRSDSQGALVAARTLHPFHPLVQHFWLITSFHTSLTIWQVLQHGGLRGAHCRLGLPLQVSFCTCSAHCYSS